MKWAIYCPCGGMPPGVRDPFDEKADAEAALQSNRDRWADSASLGRIQWDRARVLPFTGSRTTPFRGQ